MDMYNMYICLYTLYTCFNGISSGFPMVLRDSTAHISCQDFFENQLTHDWGDSFGEVSLSHFNASATIQWWFPPVFTEPCHFFSWTSKCQRSLPPLAFHSQSWDLEKPSKNIVFLLFFFTDENRSDRWLKKKHDVECRWRFLLNGPTSSGYPFRPRGKRRVAMCEKVGSRTRRGNCCAFGENQENGEMVYLSKTCIFFLFV